MMTNALTQLLRNDRAAVDAWGQPTDTHVPTGPKVPAWIRQRDKRVYDPVTGRWATVTGWEMTVRTLPGVQYTEDDQVDDLKSGTRYHVASVDVLPGTAGSFTRLTLRTTA